MRIESGDVVQLGSGKVEWTVGGGTAGFVHLKREAQSGNGAVTQRRRITQEDAAKRLRLVRGADALKGAHRFDVGDVVKVYPDDRSTVPQVYGVNGKEVTVVAVLTDLLRVRTGAGEFHVEPDELRRSAEWVRPEGEDCFNPRPVECAVGDIVQFVSPDQAEVHDWQVLGIVDDDHVRIGNGPAVCSYVRTRDLTVVRQVRLGVRIGDAVTGGRLHEKGGVIIRTPEGGNEGAVVVRVGMHGNRSMTLLIGQRELTNPEAYTERYPEPFRILTRVQTNLETPHELIPEPETAGVTRKPTAEEIAAWAAEEALPDPLPWQYGDRVVFPKSRPDEVWQVEEIRTPAPALPRGSISFQQVSPARAGVTRTSLYLDSALEPGRVILLKDFQAQQAAQAAPPEEPESIRQAFAELLEEYDNCLRMPPAETQRFLDEMVRIAEPEGFVCEHLTQHTGRAEAGDLHGSPHFSVWSCDACKARALGYAQFFTGIPSRWIPKGE